MIGAVLILVLDLFHSGLMGAAIVEFIVILFNRVTAIVKSPKKRVIVLNVVCILIIAVVAVFVFGTDILMKEMADLEEAVLQENPGFTLIGESSDQVGTVADNYGFTSQDAYLSLFLLIIVLWRIILHVVGISVSQMKLQILMNIIRETYVIEILLGLLLMIIVCATIFSTLENSMSRYIDALWYCFALVTTIGFGDISATTLIGRALSVMLGIYGIVVVAIITSVIVNFYGEVRRMNGQEQRAEKEQSDEDV